MINIEPSHTDLLSHVGHDIECMTSGEYAPAVSLECMTCGTVLLGAYKPVELKIASLTQTCSACPSQWEGNLEDGRMIYIRYRHGWLSVSVSPKPTTDVSKAVMGESIYSESIGDDLDGFIEWA